MNKKALEVNTAIIITLLIIGFFILLYIFGKAILHSNYIVSKETCRMNLIAASKTKLLTRTPLYDVQCERSKLDITLDMAKGKDGKISKDILYQVLQSELYDCYDLISQRQDPFTDWGSQDKSYCLICSEISFDEKLKARSQDFNDFNVWMLDNNVPNQGKPLNSIITSEPISADDRIEAEKADKEHPLDTSKDYVILIRWQKSSFLSNPYIGLMKLAVCTNTKNPALCPNSIFVVFTPTENIGTKLTLSKGADPEDFCTFLVN
jgi:hypothetical protein